MILAEAGAKVAVSGRSATDLDDVQKRIADIGGTAMAVAADVSKETEVIAMVERTVSKFGRLDGAFNNAGVPMHNKLTDELEADEWDGVMNVNLRAVFLCMKHQIKAMRKTGGGAIVNNSSVDSVMAIPRWTEYTVSKHAVNGLTRGAAAEAKQTGVRVNAVLPGYIVTPMSERLLNDPNLKEENAIALDRHSVKWLLSDEAAFVNGAMLAADGGFTAR